MMKPIRRALALTLCLTALLLPALAMAQESQAPNVTQILNTYTDLDLTPYLGEAVLVNFFTEWCPYCMQEMPDLKKAHEMYDEDAFQLVLVHVWDGEDETNAQSVKDKYGLHDITFFEDKDAAVTRLVGVPGYPTSLFLNPDGTMAEGYAQMLTMEMLTEQLDGMGVARKADAP